MKKMSLRWRIILPIGIILIIGISVIVGVIASNYSRTTGTMANENIQAMAANYGNSICADLKMAMGSVSTLASVFESAAGTERANRSYYIDMMNKVLQENTSMFSIWTAFEPDAFDGRDKEYAGQTPFHDNTGRYIPYIYNDGGALHNDRLRGYDVPGEGDYYLASMKSGKESITPAFYYNTGDKDFYVVSLASPVMENGKVIGVAGADLRVEPISAYVGALKVFDTGYAMLLDQNGGLVHHPKRENRGKSAYDIINKPLADACRASLRDGEYRTLEATSVRTGSTAKYAVFPFTIGETDSRWVVLLVAPKNEVMAPVRAGVVTIILAGGILMLVSLITLYVLVSRIVRFLNDINRGTTKAAEAVSGEAATISETSASLAEGATSQAASLEEISASIEEMSSMTRHNADNASKTSDRTTDNSKAISRGSEAVGAMAIAMEEINDSAGKIGHIIKSIQDIAFQTNLLALNAAVEAARAGEAGKGFAVVADEVRNLAQRSAQSANETTTLIEMTVDRVKNGTSIATNLTECFQEIESGSSEVTKLIDEIATATNEQAQGIDQINNAVATLDHTTQQAAANSEETAAAAAALNSQSHNLNEMVIAMAKLIAGEDAKGGFKIRVPLRKRLADRRAAKKEKQQKKALRLENKYGN